MGSFGLRNPPHPHPRPSRFDNGRSLAYSICAAKDLAQLLHRNFPPAVMRNFSSRFLPEIVYSRPLIRYVLLTPWIAATAALLFVFAFMGGGVVALCLSLTLGAAALLGIALYVLCATLPTPIARATGAHRRR